jgi:hypothetical protein
MFVAVSIFRMNASQVGVLFLMCRSSTQKLEMRLYFASAYTAVIQITLMPLTQHVYFQYTFL